MSSSRRSSLTIPTAATRKGKRVGGRAYHRDRIRRRIGVIISFPDKELTVAFSSTIGGFPVDCAGLSSFCNPAVPVIFALPDDALISCVCEIKSFFLGVSKRCTCLSVKVGKACVNAACFLSTTDAHPRRPEFELPTISEYPTELHTAEGLRLRSQGS